MKHSRISTEYEYPVDLDWTSDGKLLFVGLEPQHRIICYQIDNKKAEGQDKNWKLVKEFTKKHQTSINSLVLSRDNKWLVTCTDADVLLWNLKGDIVAQIDTKQMKNNCAVISRNSRFLAVGTFTSDIKIWEILYDKGGAYSSVNKTHVMSLRGHKGGILDLQFSNDSTKVVTTSNDCTWKLFDINKQYKKSEDPECLVTVSNPNKKPFQKIAISPDAKAVVASSEGDLFFYSAKGQLLKEIKSAHIGTITHVEWFQSNDRVVTSGNDASCRIFKCPPINN
eukprot:TRINITY_DN7831_c0_g1_i2.p1 TRINITY_DN7831_c0_g1~~TRINITY_DN7831_c0_g1_i2.p1  ORF type:complete len:281 (+),score=57.19 TRINITY_DN7831_c0_g1_i2:499-1341(+)